MHDSIEALMGARRGRLFPALGVAMLLASAVLAACAPGASQAAQQNKARLDRELVVARTQVGVPDSLLAPIESQETTLAASATSSDTAAAYTKLYHQVVAAEQLSPDQARAQTTTDLQQLTTAIAAVQKDGFIEAAQYQQNLQQEQQQLASTTTTKGYFALARAVEDQTAAVSSIAPVYHQMQALNAQVSAQEQAMGLSTAQPQPLQCASEDTNSFWYQDTAVTVGGSKTTAPQKEFQQWPAQDLTLFRAATTGAQFHALTTLLAAQAQQLTADTAADQQNEAYRLLQQFKADVQTYQQDGGNDASFAQQLAQDQQALNATQTLSGFATLAATLQKQTTAIALPLLRAVSQHDMQTLKALVARGTAIQVNDPANGLNYPLAYEYADQSVGIGDAESRLAQAQTLADYQAVDEEIQMYITNLRAMLQNLNDKTAVDQPHQTDMTLMQYYGVQSSKVIVVSLSEQQARIYDNGKLIHTNAVTTGAPDLPSPPGVHCIFNKLYHTKFISPYPKGSPEYYNPTPINYAMLYSDYGFYLHDAWWRAWFGKYSNLPHYDPISFNNGSHGCINFPLSDAAWVFGWVDLGTPVIVY
ncbi:MAG: L,D-transpeptidase [Ktedonobacterales bacterium]